MLAVPALYFLLFFQLTGVGLLGPDEPRYASVGREMATSGDWITPHLWGKPWFEKPVLLYWMTGIAFKLGLGEDLAPRLPVALVSLAFLIFFKRRLRGEFGERESWYATAILATCAGWISFSELCLTDLPMSAAFAAMILLLLPWVRRGEERVPPVTGVLLGLAVLAKGLVPIVLALPLLWVGRRRLRHLLLPGTVMVLTAAPWYVACTYRNGTAFLYDFFWKQHFGRFFSGGLQHVQPFWFYVPVLVAGLMPWSVLLPLLCRRKFYDDGRLRFLLLTVVFGLVFFSLSVNKLPGYLLPLLPLVAVLLGIALARAVRAGRWLVLVAASLVVVPIAVSILPQALLAGLSRSNWTAPAWYAVAPVPLVALLAWWWEHNSQRDRAVALVSLAVVAGVVFLKMTAFPILDATVSARGLWRRVRSHPEQVCVEQIHRKLRYGLNYYSVEPLPRCAETARPLHIRQRPGKPAYVAE